MDGWMDDIVCWFSSETRNGGDLLDVVTLAFYEGLRQGAYATRGENVTSFPGP